MYRITDNRKETVAINHKKIALFGGSFDPFHSTHLYIAEYVLSHCDIDYVVLIPANQNPLKNNTPLASAEDRLSIIHSSVNNYSSILISDFELNSDFDISYTIQTVQYIKDTFAPALPMQCIIGADNLVSLHKWKHIDSMLQDFVLIVVPRKGYSATMPQGMQHIAKSVTVLRDFPLSKLSSSSIRSSLCKQEGREHIENSAEEGLHSTAYLYIKENELYRRKKEIPVLNRGDNVASSISDQEHFSLDIEAIHQEFIQKHSILNTMIEKQLSQTRFQHSVNVAKRCIELASGHRYNFDYEGLWLVGFVHDLCREHSVDAMIRLAKQSGFAIEDYEQMNPILLHGKAAVGLLKKNYPLEQHSMDSQKTSLEIRKIYHAIAHHTLGFHDPSTMLLLLFLADGTSNDRELESWFFDELADLNVFKQCARLMQFHENKHKSMHAITKSMYDFCMSKG